MDREIRPTGRFGGTLRVPSDKSLTHRAVLFSSIADGVSTVLNPLEAEDCVSTARCVEALGAKVERAPGRWTVHGAGLFGFRKPAADLDCGNSGTTMRLLSGLLAAQPFTSRLSGDASLSRRPMDRVAAPLSRMGAVFRLRDGRFAPFEIDGTSSLQAIEWKNPVASAQVKSAVLLAALHARGETTFEEPALSRDHTERMLAACGVAIRRDGARVSLSGPARLPARTWDVPSDISSAAFFVVAGLIVPGARVRVEAVNVNPTRTGLLDVLKAAGANLSVQNERLVGGEPVADLEAVHSPSLGALRVDAAIAPRLIDEIPILAVAAALAGGVSDFSGVEELRHKETDRIAAIASNLRAMGGRVEERPDGLRIEGGARLRGADVDAFDDHRIAMAFAVAACAAQGATLIKGSAAVSISFPTFWSLFDRLRGAETPAAR